MKEYKIEIIENRKVTPSLNRVGFWFENELYVYYYPKVMKVKKAVTSFVKNIIDIKKKKKKRGNY